MLFTWPLTKLYYLCFFTIVIVSIIPQCNAFIAMQTQKVKKVRLVSQRGSCLERLQVILDEFSYPFFHGKKGTILWSLLEEWKYTPWLMYKSLYFIWTGVLLNKDRTIITKLYRICPVLRKLLVAIVNRLKCTHTNEKGIYTYNEFCPKIIFTQLQYHCHCMKIVSD